MTELVLRNRQRTRFLNSPLLRRIARVLLTDLLSLERCELAVHLVAAPEMARLNQRFLDHAGSTDVITFDYTGEPTPGSSRRLSAPATKLPSASGDGGTAVESSTSAARHQSSPSARQPRTGRRVSELGQPPSSPRIYGEIFICIDVAVKQARQFRTTWQSELVRYLIHGVLHALGYDDSTPADRCVMKREESRLLRMLSRQFSLMHLANAGGSRIANRKS